MEYGETADSLKALAHPTRLAILSLLSRGPLFVGEIEEMVGSTQSNVSQHLALLKKKGIVSTRREKNTIYYQVENWRIFQLIALAKELFAPAS